MTCYRETTDHKRYREKSHVKILKPFMIKRTPLPDEKLLPKKEKIKISQLPNTFL